MISSYKYRYNHNSYHNIVYVSVFTWIPSLMLGCWLKTRVGCWLLQG